MNTATIGLSFISLRTVMIKQKRDLKINQMISCALAELSYNELAVFLLGGI